MRIRDQIGGWRDTAARWRPHRPAGIRNGGLLLVLVALAAIATLVDEPPDPVAGGRLPGVFQHLPPPVGITQLPPVVTGPTPVGGSVAAQAAGDERPASADRAHPRREHPRPDDRSGSSARSGPDAVTSPVGGRPPTGGSPPPVAPPPATTPPAAAAPAARVRVPPVSVRVTPPPVLGARVPEVGVATPEIDAEVPGLTTLR